MFATALSAQQIVTTFAGTEWVFPNAKAPALETPLSSTLNTAVDPEGRVVFADTLNHIVGRVELSGTVTVIAGNGVRGFSGDGGEAARASLSSPVSVAVDKSGNILVADFGNRRIRRVTPSGSIATIAGTGNVSFSGDGGPASAAGMAPIHVNTDGAGNIYLIGNNRLRRIGPDGTITTIAGTGTLAFAGEGRPAVQVSFSPEAMHVDRTNRIFLTDPRNFRVYRIGVDGILNTIAGTGVSGYSGDGGPAAAAVVSDVSGITTDAAGNVVFTDTSNNRLRRIDASGVISTIAGGGEAEITATPSDPLQVRVGLPGSLAADTQGRIYIAAAQPGFILRLSADRQGIERVAGNGQFKEIMPRTPASLLTMSGPSGVAAGANGVLFVSDTGGHRIIEIGANGESTVLTGNGVSSCCGDNGPSSGGRLSVPLGLGVAADGALLIADSNNHRIRRVSNGVITTIAGSSVGGGYAGDGGRASEARLNGPSAVVGDAAGNVYFSDRLNHRVRRIAPDGVITTYAGNGRAGFTGDGGAATEASLNAPSGLAFNSAGELLIADYANHRVRAVSATGVIRTFAGTGQVLSNGDGRPATEAGVRLPVGLANDSQGNIYIAQDSIGVIRRIAPSGVISTFAGVTLYGFSGDGGSPLTAAFDRPVGIAADGNGNVYIADSLNNRVRVVRNIALNTTLSPSPVNLSAVAGSASSIPARVTVSSSNIGLPFRTTLNYGQGPINWLTVTASNDRTPATLTLAADATALGPGRYTATVNAVTVPAGSANAVSVVLTVSDATPRLRISAESLSMSRPEGGGANTVTLDVSNDGGGVLPYSVAATSGGAVPWLAAGPGAGELRAGEAVSVTVTADPAGLKSGTYLGSIAISAGATRRVVPVTLTVRAGRRTILVSQTGLTFTAVAGGGSPTPQKLGILNIGSGSLTWNATTSGPWIQLGTSSGTVTQPWLEVSELSVSVSPRGLRPGQYYEQIQINGDADNSPQLVTILLNVLAEDELPGPEVTPTGMIFVTRQGGNPGSQTVTFNHLGRGAATFDSSRLGNWYETAPGSGRAAADAPGSIVVQPLLADLPAGVRRGVVTFQAREDGSIRTVNLLSIVAPPDTGLKSDRSAASCPSASLRVEATSLRDGFTVRAGEAVTVEVRASDECGNVLTPLAGGTGAQVLAQPENGDPVVPLAHVGNGVWRGTWRPVRAAAITRLKIIALFLGTTADVIAGRTQAGRIELGGTVLGQGLTAAPVLTAGGVVNSASFESGVPVAPGSLVSLYGAKLAESTGLAGGVPLPTQLNGTEIRFGNKALPILFASDGQLNAQIPYDISVDTQYQISVKRGDSIAVPETLNVAAAQPGIFTKSQSGSGQGTIVKQDGATLAEAATPAVRGEVVTIFCSGLGPVSPPVEAGSPAPAAPLSSVTNAVTVTIGGQVARLQFAGLAPGFSGLYQVNVFVPAAAPAGDAVEVFVELGGQRSRPVTMAIR